MNYKIALNGTEMCAALGVNRQKIEELEQLLSDPLPYFVLPGCYEHLYPVEACSAWATRQAEKQKAERTQK